MRAPDFLMHSFFGEVVHKWKTCKYVLNPTLPSQKLERGFPFLIAKSSEEEKNLNTKKMGRAGCQKISNCRFMFWWLSNVLQNQMHLHDTQTHIHKYKYKNTNTQTQIHKHKYTNTPCGSYWPHQMPQLIDFHWWGMKHLDTYILLTGWMNPDQPARLGRQLAIWHPVDQQPSDHMSLTLSLSLTGIILYPCNALCWIHVLRRRSLSVDNSHLDQAAAPNWPRPRLRNSSQLSLLMQHWTWDYLQVQCYNIELEITYNPLPYLWIVGCRRKGYQDVKVKEISERRVHVWPFAWRFATLGFTFEADKSTLPTNFRAPHNNRNSYKTKLFSGGKFERGM